MIPNPTQRRRCTVLCRRSAIAALALWLAAFGQLAMASATEPASPLEQRLERQLEQQPLQAVYRWLAAQELPAAQRAQQLRWLGQMSMRLADYAAAVEHFEQLVLLDPLDLGSRLDLALAYAELGNTDAARSSLDALYYYQQQAGPSSALPPAAARAITQLEARLNGKVRQAPAASRLTQQLRGTLSVSQGYDSNANLGAKSRTIPLSLWGEIPMRVELADESLAQASHYTAFGGQATLPLSAVVPTASPHWQLMAGGDYRHFHQLDRLHRRDLYAGGQWQPAKRNQQLSLLALHQHVDGLPGQWSALTDYRRLLGRQWLGSLGGQWQDEPYRPASQTLRVGLWREWQQFLLHGQASWQFRPGRRAGDTWRLSARLDAPAWRWSSVAMNAYAEIEQREDSEPYSPQFFGDARRSELTTTLGARGQIPVSPDLTLVLDAGWEHSRSDIALFANRRWELEARLAWRW